VLSGMRPTGKLHLGNYMGALVNWVRLQREYECYFFIADWHALTTDYADTSLLPQNIREVALDWLAAGLDPEQCTIFLQSQVPQHAELHLLFSMITPLGWLERVPTYKEQQENLTGKDLTTYGFLGYPLLQAADILLYQAQYVPVGQDQVAHVELTREVARRFNFFFPKNPNGLPPIEYANHPLTGRSIVQRSYTAENADEMFKPSPDVLVVPKELLTPSPKLPGTDGRKMSKSYGNTILLSDPEPVIRQKLKSMVTDPARVRRSDAGDPDKCPVFDLHKVFSGAETQDKAREGCTTAGIGCIECKGWLADSVVAELAPMQERRAKYEAPGVVEEILEQGRIRATKRAAQTMREARAAVGLPAEPPTEAKP
jgi:tryptophanyl-tRNA synthetase